MLIPEFQRLGVKTPIFAFSHCRDVVVAVSKAGGFGVYGAVLHSDRQIAIDLQWIEDQLGGLPYGVDLLMPSKYVGSETGGLSPEEARAAIPPQVTEFLDDMMVRYQVPDYEDDSEDAAFAAVGNQRYTAREAQRILDIAFTFNPRLLVSGLGVPPVEVVERAHARGMLVAGLAGLAKHARRHVEAGCDIIIAQSYEAGGHTGEIGGMILTPEVVDAVAPVPVLAAGGIGDGRQMAAALALGAKGVWCGSVWLTTVESDVLPVVKQKLIAASSADTVRTRSMTGKPSRLLRTAWVEEWERPDTPDPVPHPLHPVAIGRYIERIDRAAAGEVSPSVGAGALANTPVGQLVGSLTQETSCRQVLINMMEGCIDALAHMQDVLEYEG
jgi:NAD(P)H-dependent flavin oxidoreductase YrpB (nitropropane dioxygenase family)